MIYLIIALAILIFEVWNVAGLVKIYRTKSWEAK